MASPRYSYRGRAIASSRIGTGTAAIRGPRQQLLERTLRTQHQSPLSRKPVSVVHQLASPRYSPKAPIIVWTPTGSFLATPGAAEPWPVRTQPTRHRRPWSPNRAALRRVALLRYSPKAPATAWIPTGISTTTPGTREVPPVRVRPTRNQRP